jgi:serine/threonine-protein kinase
MAEPEPEIDPVARRASARIGQVLRGKWRIERLLGVGGMAAVYEGLHRNGKRGAIKLLHPEISIDEDARRRFLREGYAANRVEHPGAVSVLDDDVAEDGAVFLVMELLEGRSVGEVAEAQPGARLDVATTLNIADQALDVLTAAHHRGIVHRDLKPDNLFLKRDGTLKVLDFGLARVQDHQSGAATATRTGSAMGTPAFMAPEQALGNWSEVDGRTDLWAIGATMFSLLTGRLVHEAATMQQLFLAAMTKPAPPLRSIRPDVPPAIAAVVDRALAFNRDARWSDAHAMQRALREAGQASLGHAPRAVAVVSMNPVRGVTSPSLLGATFAVVPSVPPRRAHRAALLGVAAGLVLAALATIGVLRPWARGARAISAAAVGDPATTATTATTATPATTATTATPPVVEAAPPPEPAAVETSTASAARVPAPRASVKAPTASTPTTKPSARPPGKTDPFGAWQ